MNDDDLITAVRQCASRVRMNVPAERIISRGRSIRVRRRVQAAASATLAATAGTVLAITLPAAPSHPSAVQLTAWTVVNKPGDGVMITIRQLRDPAGLQQRLRADGIPASVTYYGHLNPSCHLYPAGIHRYEHVFPMPQLIPGKSVPARSVIGTKRPDGKSGPSYLIWIRVQALPRGAGVQIAATVRHGRIVIAEPKLVHARPGCTGN